MKEKGKRLLSLALAIATLIGMLPVSALAALQTEGQLLPVTELPKFDEYAPGYAYVGIATAQCQLEEQGAYLLTIRREGDTATEASVELRTLDVQARYGADYRVEDSRYHTEVSVPEQTVVEQISDETLAAGQEMVDELNELLDGGSGAEETIPVEEPVPTEVSEPAEQTAPENAPVEAEEPAAQEAPAEESVSVEKTAPVETATDVSVQNEGRELSLAERKALQTGLPTRETEDMSTDDIRSLQELVETVTGVDPTEQLDCSSSTRIVFAPGETEKQVRFVILEDRESEDTENFTFMLGAPGEHTAIIEDAASAAFLIRDDEPIVYSAVSFSAESYTAADGKAVVTLTRSGALYSDVLVSVRSGATENAAQGAVCDETLEFVPNAETVSFTLENVSENVTLELYDLEGGVAGERTVASVRAATATVQSVSVQEAGGVTINNVTYAVGPDHGGLSELKLNGRAAGVRFSPTYTKKAFDGYSCSGGDKARRTVDVTSDCIRIKYASNWPWDKGWTAYRFDLRGFQRYQSLHAMARQTAESTSAVSGLHFGTTRKGYDVLNDVKRNQQGLQLYSINLVQKDYSPPVYDDSAGVSIDVRRDGAATSDPTMEVTGLYLLYRVFHVDLKEAEKLKYLDGYSTQERVPAHVSNNNQEYRYWGEKLTMNESIPSGNQNIDGILKGFKITTVNKKEGKRGTTFFWETNVPELTFGNDLMRKIDDSARNGKISLDENETNVEVVPVYDYKPVQVSIKGTAYAPYVVFLGNELSALNKKPERMDKTTFHMGDTISVAAADTLRDAPAEFNGFKFQGTQCDAYVGAADKAKLEADSPFLSARQPNLRLKHVRYELKPVFAKEVNYISVTSDYIGAKGPFSFRAGSVLSEDELKVLKEANITYVENANSRRSILKVNPIDYNLYHTAAPDKKVEMLLQAITATPGQVYAVELLPAGDNAENLTQEPNFYLSHAPGRTTRAWTYYFTAGTEAKSNQVFVTQMSLRRSDAMQYVTLRGRVNFAEYPMMATSRKISDEPAGDTVVTAAVHCEQQYSGASLRYLPQTVSAQANDNGEFELTVKRFGSEDVPLLLEKNGVRQVCYFYIPAFDSNRVSKEVYVPKNSGGKTEMTLTTVQSYVAQNNSPITMPTRTYYTPYAQNLWYEYSGVSSLSVDTRNTTLPIIPAEDNEAKLIFHVDVIIPAGQDVKEVRFIRKGMGQDLTKAAVTSSTAVGTQSAVTRHYTCEFDPRNDFSEGAQVFVQVVDARTQTVRVGNETRTVEIAYPAMNTGLRFFVPVTASTPQNLEFPIPDFAKTFSEGNSTLKKVPMLNDMGGKIDSGKLNLDVKYADPSDPKTSPLIVSLVGGLTFDGEGTYKDPKTGEEKQYFTEKGKKLQEMKYGKSGKASGTVDEMISDTEGRYDVAKLVNANEMQQYTDEFKSKNQGSAEYRNYTDEQWKEAAKTAINKDAAKKQALKESISRNAYKESLNKQGKFAWNVQFKLGLQMAWIYDKENNKRVLGNVQILIGGGVGMKKTFYTFILALPVYLDVSGDIMLTVGTQWITDRSKKISYEETRKKQNLAGVSQTERWYFQPSTNIKLQIGAGVCGVAGARGYITFSYLVRVYIGSVAHAQGGTTGTVGGGIAIDALVTTFNFNIGEFGWGTGIFDKSRYALADASGNRAFIASSTYADTPETLDRSVVYEPRMIDPGEEKPNYTAALQSTMTEEEGAEVQRLINGGVEYMRPQLLRLDDGRLMLVFLRSEAESKDAANASTLEYAVQNADGSWPKDGNGNLASTVIDTGVAQGDGINTRKKADTMPAVLLSRDGSKVFVAWSTAHVSDDIGIELETTRELNSAEDAAKKAMQDLDVMLAVYDVKNQTMSAPIVVEENGFVNSHVMLFENQVNQTLEICYFTQDISAAKTAEQLMSTTYNYNTWTRKTAKIDSLNADSVEFATVIGKLDNKAYEEEYIVIENPTQSDPLVTDYTVNGFAYSDPQAGVPEFYRVAAYTVDGDSNQGTVTDRQLWVKVDNLSKGRRYYPVMVDGGNGAYNVALTATGGDLFLTWFSNDTVLNTIPASDIFAALDYDYGAELPNNPTKKADGTSALAYLRGLSTDVIGKNGWMAGLSDAYPSLTRLKNMSAARDWAATDFGERYTTDTFSENGAETSENFSTGRAPSDYRLVAGRDDCLYLFWTELDQEPEWSGMEIYGSAFRQKTAQDGNEAPTGWSKPVQITGTPTKTVGTGEDERLIHTRAFDEIAVAVDKERKAVIVGNCFDQSIGEKGVVQYDNRALVQVNLVPASSLELSVDGIELDEDTPLPGETVMASFTVENNGLHSAEKEDYEVRVSVTGGKLLTDNGETTSTTLDLGTLYAGLSTDASVQWQVSDPASDKIAVEVKEKVGGSLQAKGRWTDTEQLYTAVLPVYCEPELQNLSEDVLSNLFDEDYDEEVYDELKGLTFDGYDLMEPDSETEAVARAAFAMKEPCAYYAVLPVVNTGNEEGAMTVTATLLEAPTVEGGEYRETVLLGSGNGKLTAKQRKDENGESTVSNDPVTYIAIPLDKLDIRKHVDEYGEFGVKLQPALDGVEQEPLYYTFYLRQNSLLTFEEGETLSMTVGGTHTLKPTSYPFRGADLVYSSSNPDVVSVAEDGTLKALSAGKVEIIAYDPEGTVDCCQKLAVTVTEKAAPSGPAVPVAPNPGAAVTGGTSGDVSYSGIRTEIAAPSGTAPVTTAGFADVPADSWYSGSVDWAVSRGVTNGVGANRFGPDGVCTRAQMVTFLWRAVGSPEPKGNAAGFADVSAGSWYEKAVAWAVENGVTNGRDKGFDPDGLVTRAEAVTFLARARGGDMSGAANFTDVAADSWYAGSVAWAVGNGITNGMGGNLFEPNTTVTRAMAVTFLGRAYGNI